SLERSVKTAARSRQDGIARLGRNLARTLLVLERAEADDPVGVGRPRAGLEGLHDYAFLALAGPHAGGAVDGDPVHALGHAEGHGLLAFEHLCHELLEDRSRKAAAGRAVAERARLVETEIE